MRGFRQSLELHLLCCFFFFFLCRQVKWDRILSHRQNWAVKEAAQNKIKKKLLSIYLYRNYMLSFILNGYSVQLALALCSLILLISLLAHTLELSHTWNCMRFRTVMSCLRIKLLFGSSAVPSFHTFVCLQRLRVHSHELSHVWHRVCFCMPISCQWKPSHGKKKFSFTVFCFSVMF